MFMAVSFEPFRTNTLILLVGGNPLPNYVAAYLLTQPQNRTVLVHSSDTNEQRQRLERVLRDENWQKIETVEVNESDPVDIYNKVQQIARGAEGSIGLNYTGGTKAMAVHAYRAIEQLQDAQERIFSYLDARTLSMVFWHHQSPVRVDNQVQVSLETLLALHGLDTMKQNMKRSPVENLHHTRAALLDLHTDPVQVKSWHAWCDEKLRQDNGKLKKGEINALTSDDLAHSSVTQALAQDRPDLPLPQLLRDVAAPLKGRSLAKWLQGDWLEEYVFLQVQQVQDTDPHIHDSAMTINPKIGSTDFEFEFDVAFMRGHQFFGISVTTDDKKFVKPKLLEAIVRSEQLGGGEARCALVCCADSENVHKLQAETIGLPNHNYVRVFGAKDLPDLSEKMKAWIKECVK
jgi:hypothetical protein